VLGEGVPVLGICVGMQIMARSSDEGESQGLNWIDGKICHLNNLMVNQGLILPHMGWNDVSPIIAQPLFSEIVHPRFYFLHSYYFIPSQRSEALSTTVYGDNFTSAVCRNRIYGVQFHPEKSHAWGIQLLKNFALS
jgi:glutamine amidotransferase